MKSVIQSREGPKGDRIGGDISSDGPLLNEAGNAPCCPSSRCRKPFQGLNAPSCLNVPEGLFPNDAKTDMKNKMSFG